MTVRLGLVILRQYRFELGFAVLAAAVAGLIGLITHLRIDALAVSQTCLEQVRGSADGSDLEAQCFRMARTGIEILGTNYLNRGGPLQMSLMGMLPFVLGIFGGIPIVARELEDRTAQTAWSLHGSRSRWLLQRLAPTGLVLMVAAGCAAIAASLVAEDWVRWYGQEQARLLGTHGLPVVARAFGAFGVGLATGALLGRTFPAFLASVALLFVVMLLSLQVRDAWLAQLPMAPLWELSSRTGQWESIGGAPREVAWGGPSGEILSVTEARQRASEAGVAPPLPGAPYDTAAEQWLVEHGYAEITLGTTDAAAAGWAPYDATAFLLIGSAGLAAAFVIVGRRRP